jgi:threonine dehydrogenase-like Zn-dependent dehydrogenase
MTSLRESPTATTMTAAVFVRPGVLAIEQRPIPVLAGDDEVLVAVEACGICGTDLHILEDPPGHPADEGVVLGHELVGHVIESGALVLDLRTGDRVVVSPNVSCMNCGNCKAGLFSACTRFSSIGIFRDGALAEVVSVPARCCFTISEDIPAPIAALTEPLSCVMNGIRQASPIPGQYALIYGAGAIGLLFCAVLTAGGVRCIVSEPSSARRSTAITMGAWRAVDPIDEPLDEVVRTLTGDGVDIAVDAAGSRFADAIQHTRAGGKVLLFGFNTRAVPPIQQSWITRRELLIYGTWTGRFVFPDAVRLMESGLLDLRPLAEHVYPVIDAERAFATLRSGEATKVILVPS